MRMQLKCEQLCWFGILKRIIADIVIVITAVVLVRASFIFIFRFFLLPQKISLFFSLEKMVIVFFIEKKNVLEMFFGVLATLGVLSLLMLLLFLFLMLLYCYCSCCRFAQVFLFFHSLFSFIVKE